MNNNIISQEIRLQCSSQSFSNLSRNILSDFEPVINGLGAVALNNEWLNRGRLR